VSADCLKLTTYFGERDRAGRRFLADALLDVYGHHELRVSALFRGTEGFGARHHLHTQRLLTLSEALPIVAVAVDRRERIEHVLPEVERLTAGGLVTLERARLLEGPDAVDETSKLTVYVGRKERLGGRPAYLGIVDALHRHGAAGASVLLGVDGTAHGVRRRARFFGANPDVPLMVISVGDGGPIARASAELAGALARPLMTLERVRVCKRDGVRLADPHPPSTRAAVWHKLMVYARAPVHAALMRRLRESDAAGATALRAIWGYHGDHAPHGETLWSLRRDLPVLTVALDTPERIARTFAIVDELTARSGLVTSELVPAVRRG
jgi:PII-like signaling protein